MGSWVRVNERENLQSYSCIVAPRWKGIFDIESSSTDPDPRTSPAHRTSPAAQHV